MELHNNWAGISEVFAHAIRSSRHCAIATVNPDGTPHVTPIGFIFLRNEPSAYYFEEHARQLPLNLKGNSRVSVLLVNSGTLFWGKFLLSGKMSAAPGIRLFGVASDRRQASSEELEALHTKIGLCRWTRGSKKIWGHLKQVRDISFDRFEPVRYVGVTDGLFEDGRR